MAVNAQEALCCEGFIMEKMKNWQRWIQMTDKFAHVVIEVNGSKMTLLIDGKEILNYTDSENWTGMQPKVQLINMTKGRRWLLTIFWWSRFARRNP